MNRLVLISENATSAARRLSALGDVPFGNGAENELGAQPQLYPLYALASDAELFDNRAIARNVLALEIFHEP
jgi:hypothetical protein